MKKISILSITTLSAILTLMTFFESEAQSTAQLKKTIDLFNENFVIWFNSGQIDSLVNGYVDNACLEGRGCGKEFIRNYYESESTKYEFQELSTLNLTVKDNLATETGRWRIILPTGIVLFGTYQSEWKRIGEKWVIVKDMTVTTGQ